MPAASWIGFSATISCIVEQFGLAMMPLWSSSASGLTSATTSGISGSRRKAEELSTTTQPAAAKRGAHSREVVAPAEKSAMSKPWIDSSVSGLDDQPALELAAGRALGGERDELADRRSARSRSFSSITVPTAPVAPTTATRRAHGLKGCSGRTSSAPSSNASCSARTACGDAVGGDDAGDLDRRGGDHLDVDFLVAERGEHLRGDAGMRLHSRADDGHLPHRRVLGDPEDADVGDDRVERRAGGREVGARDREAHVGAARPRTPARSG